MVIAYVFAVMAQVIAGSVLLKTVISWSYQLSVLVSEGIVAMYTVLGRLWAASLMDFIRLTTTFVGVTIALLLACIIYSQYS